MSDAKQIWEDYCKNELEIVVPLLDSLGYVLDSLQPHIWGERYLMQAVTTTSGKKLILLGSRKSDHKRVVIKTTSDPAGIRELEHERNCRRVLQEIKFAYQIFLSPEEILFVKKGRHVISIQAFIEQKSAFLERPLEEQFSLALKSFKAQESAHATTYEHVRLIKKTFGSMNARAYGYAFAGFIQKIKRRLADDLELTSLLDRAQKFLEINQETIDQYGNFLTHTDFVPHNFRVVESDIYLLDYSSLRFGNKYEGWARFLNFMTLYNRPLEEALTRYVHDNRTPEEVLSLKLMRVYRLGEIIWYYTSTLDKSSGNLLELNTNRVAFWSKVLEAVLIDKSIDQKEIEDYQRARDLLRSSDEKQRQQGLH